MLRSLYAAVSGLRTHQLRLDVIGSNIANVNTYGFKRGVTTFKDLLSQTVAGASAPTAENGGTNPIQVGLGVQVGSVSQNFSQGNLQFTGSNTDLAVEGNGMFVLRGGGSDSIRLSRAGSFALDANGTLVDPASGYKVQGWMADATGAIVPNAITTDLVVPMGGSVAARGTGTVEYGQNINSQAAVGDTMEATSYVYDSLGALHPVALTFTKTGNNAWSWAAASPEAGVTVTGSGAVTFDPTTGAVLTGGADTIDIDPGGGLGTTTMAADFSQVTQFAAGSSLTAQRQDGYAAGQLEQFSIDGRGVITGSYSNGRILNIGQIAMASVANPAGLVKEGNNYYAESPNSGLPQVGEAGLSGRGRILSGTLETSNVDLSQEFTDLITAQRGFQANARMVTTSDEVLQELLNLKR